jgi:hypothetical protein
MRLNHKDTAKLNMSKHYKNALSPHACIYIIINKLKQLEKGLKWRREEPGREDEMTAEAVCFLSPRVIYLGSVGQGNGHQVILT